MSDHKERCRINADRELGFCDCGAEMLDSLAVLRAQLAAANQRAEAAERALKAEQRGAAAMRESIRDVLTEGECGCTLCLNHGPALSDALLSDAGRAFVPRAAVEEACAAMSQAINRLAHIGEQEHSNDLNDARNKLCAALQAGEEG
jgi:hypothetical protein